MQGVGFRYFALDAARRDGINGYVMNHEDGTVEAVAEGESEALERFERALRRGPSRSRVEHVVVDDTTPQMLDTGFEIRWARAES